MHPDEALLGLLHMSVTERSMNRSGQIQRCVKELQVPTSYHRNGLRIPLLPAAVMVHDFIADIG